MGGLPVFHATTLQDPLQWNQGSDIAGCPSPHCPLAQASPVGPLTDATPEGHPGKGKWATDSQTAHWSNPWPWSLGTRRGGHDDEDSTANEQHVINCMHLSHSELLYYHKYLSSKPLDWS